MAACSSVLAWRIPWTEKSGRLQSMGSQESDTAERLNHHIHVYRYPVGCVSLEPTNTETYVVPRAHGIHCHPVQKSLLSPHPACSGAGSSARGLNIIQNHGASKCKSSQAADVPTLAGVTDLLYLLSQETKFIRVKETLRTKTKQGQHSPGK